MQHVIGAEPLYSVRCRSRTVVGVGGRGGDWTSGGRDEGEEGTIGSWADFLEENRVKWLVETLIMTRIVTLIMG